MNASATDRPVAIVTGGAGGIGRAIAERFVRDRVAVAIIDVDSAAATKAAETLASAGATTSAHGCDVTDAGAVDKTIGDIASRFGRVDMLVTCAGVTRDNLIHRLSIDDWTMVVDTHLTGTFLCARAAQRLMVPARSGRMVFVSSGAARGNPGQANYASAKAGIEGLARTLAIELGRFGICVNAVAPGFVDTEMARAAADRAGLDWSEFTSRIADSTPLGRIAAPDDIAGVVAFLCGDDARFVNGQTISVRGGP